MPHSLVSLHMVYPESAFDEYDVIFSCGPHHEREIRAIASLRGLPQPATHRVGYGRFDLMKTADLQEAENRRVLLAPSWGESNILSVMGTWLISGLLDSNYEVYLRPHPSFFFYKDSSIETLRTTFAGRRFVLEDSTTTPTHSWAASVLISDYSGIGLEYAAHRRRPVVFVDVAKKVLNPNWPALGMEPVEVGLRQELGIIAQPQPSSVINAVTAIAQHERLSRQVIDRYCFQPEHVGACAAQLLAQYVKPG